MTKNPQHRNTVADNIKGDIIPTHWVGYYLKDGSFGCVAGGTGYTRKQCETLAKALQPRYYHTLTVIDKEQFDGNPRNFNV